MHRGWIAAALVAIGCAATSPEAQQANRDFTSAIVAPEKSEDAWQLAQSCIATIDPAWVAPIAVATATVINTSRPSGPQIWMSAVRTPEPDGRVRIWFDAGSDNLMLINRAVNLAITCAQRTRI